jgi:hypothetical protein
MPTSLPQAVIKFQSNEARDRQPSHLFIFVSVFFAIVGPPILLCIVAAACVGHGEVSLKSIEAVFEAAGNAELCAEQAICADDEAP